MPDTSPVIVIQVARFGDVVQTRRLIATLHAAGHAVHLLVDSSLVELAGLVHPECTVHGVPVHGNCNPEAAVRAVVQCCERLRAYEFAAVYTLNFSPITYALAAAFPAARTVGYSWHAGQVVRHPWLSLAFRWSSQRVHAPCNLADVWAHLHQNPMAAEKVNPPAVPRGGGLGVVMAGRNARRSLPPRVLAGCVAAMAERAGKERTIITFLGSKSEAGVAKALLDALPGSLRSAVVDRTGKTGWQQLYDVVGGLDAVLTPDTGTMHLAARLGVPVVATFLASAWAWETGPYGEGHTIWQAITDDTPCMESQACPCEANSNGPGALQSCLTPFSERAFLRLLAMNKGEPPAQLVQLSSRCDALGCDFVPVAGRDPHAATRAVWRRVLMADRGCAADIEHSESGDATRGAAVAARLYYEADWALHAPSNLEAC